MKHKKTIIRIAIIIGVLAIVAVAIHIFGGGAVEMIKTHMGL